jgi:hypothetical protein
LTHRHRIRFAGGGTVSHNGKPQTTTNTNGDKMTTHEDTDTRPDYKIAAEQLQQAFDALGIKATIRGGHLDCDDSGWKHYAFNVLFESASGAASFDWRSGTGNVKPKNLSKRDPRFRKDDPVNMEPVKPNPAEVLGRICAEYSEARASSFEDWAWSLGYDSDSRKALRIYEECLAHQGKLSRIGINSETFNTLRDLSNRL